MALTTLKTYNQATMLGARHGGACFGMCAHVLEARSLWGGARTYAEVVSISAAIRAVVSITNAGRSIMLARAQANYPTVLGALTNLRIFKAEVFVGAAGAAIAAPNHEVMVATNGDGSRVCFFDPNSGFYEATAVGATNALGAPVALANNRTIFEHYLKAAAGYAVIGSLGYSAVKTIR